MAAQLSPAEQLAQFLLLLDAIQANRIVNYAYVASCAILSFDYFITLPQEVEHMWPAKFSLPKALYFTVRYYSFIHMGICFGYHVNTSNVGAACNAPFNRLAFSSLTAHALCEAISYVRVYGFSGKNPILAVLLSIAFTTTTVLQYYFLNKFNESLIFAEIPWRGIGCVPAFGESLYLSIVFTLVLANVTIITGIMMFIAYKRRKYSHGVGGLMQLFYRDGIFYFVALSTLATANIIFDHTAPPNGLQFTLVQIQVFLNQVCTMRMLLHLRAWAKKSSSRGYIDTPHSHGSRPFLGELTFSGTDAHTEMTTSRSTMALSSMGKAKPSGFQVSIEVQESYR